MTNPGLEPLRTSAQVRDELLLVEREHRRAVDTAQELSGRRKFTQADAVRTDRADLDEQLKRCAATIERTTSRAVALRDELQLAMAREAADQVAPTMSDPMA